MDEAVARFFSNIGKESGTLLILDDLQWAAGDAIDMLAMLAHSRATLRMIGAFRQNEVGGRHSLESLMSDLAHAQLVAHLRLGPLSEDASATLLGRLLDTREGVPDQVAARVIDRADGVPFFLVSWARGLLRNEVTSQESEGAIPWNLAQSVKQRISVLPDDAREVLSLAALIGRRVPRSLVAAMAGAGREATLMGLAMACHAGLLEEAEGGDYHFVHDVVREVIERDLGGPVRAALHRRIGEALELTGGPPESLAYHYVRSFDDDKAILYLERAGERAESQHANASAEGYYRELADRLEGAGRAADAASARERLGRMLKLGGRYPEAMQELDAAGRRYAESGDRDGEARVAAEIGRVHYLQGSPDKGIELLSSLLVRLETAPASAAVAEVDTVLASLHMLRGD
jgi:predicted ATPase